MVRIQVAGAIAQPRERGIVHSRQVCVRVSQQQWWHSLLWSRGRAQRFVVVFLIVDPFQQDDGTVNGLHLLRHKKDLIRRGVDAALHYMRPPVDPLQVAVTFHAVYDLSLGQHVPLRDVYVVTVYVPKGSAAFYTNSTGQAFVRREGSVHAMTPEMIRERVAAECKAHEVKGDRWSPL